MSTISRRELVALLTAWLVLGVSFSMGYLGYIRVGKALDFALIFLMTLVIIGTGFLGHELAHKFTAERYGCWAEFKLWTYGAIMALLFAIVSGGTFVFAAPGAVYIASRSGYFGEGLDRRANGIVSIMGPLVNLAGAIAFFSALGVAGLFGVGDFVIGGFKFLWSGAWVNLWLGAFNMLPIFVLDGQKVFTWDRRAWALLAVPLWAAVFVRFLSGT